MSSRPLVMMITGPTASGKSAIAIRLARRLDGEIVSADSMQIYRGLNIGTAKVSTEDQAAVPHHLIDIIDPCEAYSVADFLSDARLAISEILQRDKLPIVCGGTGQYLTALLDGLQFQEEASISLEEREAVKSFIEKEGLIKAHQRLSVLDPVSGSRIHPNDKKRITRFFEVYQLTGKTQSEMRIASRQKSNDFRFRSYCLLPDRQNLYQRINERTQMMIHAGLEKELRELLELYPDFPETQAFQSIGYKEIAGLLHHEIDEEQAAEALAQATRRYAKRQLSLFRSRKEDLHFVEADDLETAFQIILADFLRFRHEFP